MPLPVTGAPQPQSPQPPEPDTHSQALKIRHIRFAIEGQPGDIVRRRFTEPRPSLAVEQPGISVSLSSAEPCPESLEDLYVMTHGTAVAADAQKAIEGWLAAQDSPDAPQPITVRVGGTTLRWRPGRAVVESMTDAGSMLAVLIEFSFLESELRRLERELSRHEASALDDISIAYQIRRTDQRESRRLGQIMQDISRLRLTFARLEPCFGDSSRSLPSNARKTITRLIARAGVTARLEAFDSRLEACEELYEGAVDRMADFRWYHHGELLEITIVVLLVMELIATVLSLRSR